MAMLEYSFDFKQGKKGGGAPATFRFALVSHVSAIKEENKRHMPAISREARVRGQIFTACSREKFRTVCIQWDRIRFDFTLDFLARRFPRGNDDETCSRKKGIARMLQYWSLFFNR